MSWRNLSKGHDKKEGKANNTTNTVFFRLTEDTWHKVKRQQPGRNVWNVQDRLQEPLTDEELLQVTKMTV